MNFGLRLSRLHRMHIRSSLLLPTASVSYAAFVQAKFPEIRSNNPSMKNPDILREIGALYRQLPDDEKAKLVLDTPSVKYKGDRVPDKKRQLAHARRHGFPRRPASSGLNIFFQEKLAGRKGISLSTGARYFQETAQLWNALPEASRKEKLAKIHEGMQKLGEFVIGVQKEYNDKAKLLKDTYHQDIRLWAEQNGVKYSNSIQEMTKSFYLASSSKKATGRQKPADKTEPDMDK